jgi:ATP:corrinoid adenosyltransferase
MAAPEGNKFAEGNEGGRPTKYKDEYAEQAYKLCLLGFTDAELGTYFEVHEDTINEWKKVHEVFSVSVGNGKAKADAEIANSLYERAKGCTITVQQAIKLTTKTPDHNGKISQTEEIEIVDLTQEVPPDTVAAKFWLMNRQPDKWREKTENINRNLNYNTELTPEKIKEISEALENNF